MIEEALLIQKRIEEEHATKIKFIVNGGIYFFCVYCIANHPISSDVDVIIIVMFMVFLCILIFVFPWNHYVGRGS